MALFVFLVLMLCIICFRSFVSFNKKRKKRLARSLGKYYAMFLNEKTLNEKQWWQIYSRIRHYSLVPFYYGAIELGLDQSCPLDPDLIQAFVNMADTMEIRTPRTKRHLNAIMRAYARHGIVPTNEPQETEIILVS